MFRLVIHHGWITGKRRQDAKQGIATREIALAKLQMVLMCRL